VILPFCRTGTELISLCWLTWLLLWIVLVSLLEAVDRSDRTVERDNDQWNKVGCSDAVYALHHRHAFSTYTTENEGQSNGISNPLSYLNKYT
jgi:hypothetical protein